MAAKDRPALPGYTLDDMPASTSISPDTKAVVIALLAVENELRLTRLQGEAMSEIAGIQLKAIKAMTEGGIVQGIVVPGAPGSH